MKKFLKSLIAVVCCVCVTPFAFAGCGGGEDVGDDAIVNEFGQIVPKPGGKTSKIKFWINGDDNEIKVFRNLVNQFNASTGKEYNIEVKMIQRTGSTYGDILGQSLAQGNAGDVFYVGDSGYKQYAENNYLYDITPFVEGGEITQDGKPVTVAKSDIYKVEDMWDNVVTRYKYNVKTYESGDVEGGRYYGVPKDLGPTVIFYNETYFEGAGIKILSVAPEDLAAFNDGAKEKDDRGSTKADLGLTGVEVKEKGYFVVNNQKYFNNQVPMNWDETHECASVVQNYMRNTLKKGGSYGYFTEWWFNYGWSVGGNCIQQIPSDKYNCGFYYDFTLMDNTKNYIVKDGAGEVTVNGHKYKEREIISYQDKLDMSIYNGKKAADGANMYQNASNYRITDEVQSLYAAGKLNELPSQREAFAEFVRIGDITTGSGNNKRFVEIDGKEAYGISMLPTDMEGDAGKTAEFEAGRLGMLVDGRWNVTKFRASSQLKGITWDVAPLPMYKEYDAEGNITVRGIEAGHSGSVGLCISAKSKNPIAAWKFIEYCGGEQGQAAQAQAGFAIPLQKKLAQSDVFIQKDKMPKNSKIFINATTYEQAGDWWFLQDNKWIDEWANLLNGSVRNGDTTFQQFFESKEYKNTFSLLEKYTK